MTGARDDLYRAAAVALLARDSTRRLDELAARAAAALGEAGVPSLLLRGPVLARWLYDDPRERIYHDVDLLVAEPEHERAVQALRAIGMRRVLEGAAASEAAPHAACMESSRGDVDLHWTVKGTGAPPAQVWSALWRGCERMSVGDAALAVPRAEARALIVALHACQHGPQGAVQLADLERAVRRLGSETWQGAAALASELDALPWFAGGLRHVAGGEALLAAMGVDTPGDLDVEIRAMGDVPLLRGLAELSRTPGAGAKARLLAREAFPTRVFMREWSPLARRGLPGLVAAYAGRPFWLTARLVSAYRAFRRARRQAS